MLIQHQFTKFLCFGTTSDVWNEHKKQANKQHTHSHTNAENDFLPSSAFPALCLGFTILGEIFAFVTVCLIQPLR